MPSDYASLREVLTDVADDLASEGLDCSADIVRDARDRNAELEAEVERSNRSEGEWEDAWERVVVEVMAAGRKVGIPPAMLKHCPNDSQWAEGLPDLLAREIERLRADRARLAAYEVALINVRASAVARHELGLVDDIDMAIEAAEAAAASAEGGE